MRLGLRLVRSSELKVKRSLESTFCCSTIGVGFALGEGDRIVEGSGVVGEGLAVVVGVLLELGAGEGDSDGEGFVLVPSS